MMVPTNLILGNDPISFHKSKSTTVGLYVIVERLIDTDDCEGESLSVVNPALSMGLPTKCFCVCAFQDQSWRDDERKRRKEEG